MMALVVSVKSDLGNVNFASCSGVQSLTSTSWLSFIVSAVGVAAAAIAAKLLLEELGLIL